MQSNHYDTLIIGAGMSGLAAGIRIAYYNKRVCILDRHYMPGGLNSFYKLDGRQFDVGLHAMTNYVPRGVRNAPLNKLLRQLRLKYDDFQLCPQVESDIRFPGVKLRFSNDFALFESEVCEKFPAQADRFRKLVKFIHEYPSLDLNTPPVSARKMLSEMLAGELLIEMLFCPLMFYGSANEDDMEFGQFAIMFKSIFCEGFARPREGVRQIISTLLKKYKSCHGELRMKTGVRSLRVESDRVGEVELDSGEILTASNIISSAGLVETLRLCSDVKPETSASENAGKVTFMESISVLDRMPADFDYHHTITFFNDSPKFHYRPPQELADPRSGVICCPNNFNYSEPLDEGIVRVTSLASFDGWKNLPQDEYVNQKKSWYEKTVASAVRFVPDFRPYVTYIDTFTPRTVHKFTGHLNGAVYGAPDKVKTGRTRLKNLFICGTDQGFLGIVGAMLSGISMANMHVLQSGGES